MQSQILDRAEQGRNAFSEVTDPFVAVSAEQSPYGTSDMVVVDTQDLIPNPIAERWHSGADSASTILCGLHGDELFVSESVLPEPVVGTNSSHVVGSPSIADGFDMFRAVELSLFGSSSRVGTTLISDCSVDIHASVTPTTIGSGSIIAEIPQSMLYQQGTRTPPSVISTASDADGSTSTTLCGTQRLIDVAQRMLVVYTYLSSTRMSFDVARGLTFNQPSGVAVVFDDACQSTASAVTCPVLDGAVG